MECDGASHQIQQTFDDRHPKASPPKAASNAGIGLNKRLEDTIKLSLSHTATSVYNLDR